jgi:transmembrane sensor
MLQNVGSLPSLPMPYTRYTTSDFVLDISFQAFVLCTDPEAVAFWTNWLTQNPDREAQVQEATELVRLLTGPKQALSLPNKEAELRRLIEQLPASHSSFQSALLRRPGFTVSPWRRGAYRLAAAVALLLLVGSGWFLAGRFGQPTHVVLKTDYGQKRSLFLPDGSEVILNANSTLRYRPDWPDGETRVVWLEGEAFFHVSKRQAAGKPVKFTVQAGGLAIEVLGTQFNVLHRSKRTQVVLEEGKVRLLSNATRTPLLDMTPGETVVYSHRDQLLSRQQVDPQLYDAWRDNRLVFDNTPLSEVAEIIRQTYGKSVTFADSDLMSRRLSGTIPGDDLDRLTKALARAFNLRITQQGDELLIEAQ